MRRIFPESYDLCQVVEDTTEGFIRRRTHLEITPVLRFALCGRHPVQGFHGVEKRLSVRVSKLSNLPSYVLFKFEASRTAGETGQKSARNSMWSERDIEAVRPQSNATAEDT